MEDHMGILAIVESGDWEAEDEDLLTLQNVEQPCKRAKFSNGSCQQGGDQPVFGLGSAHRSSESFRTGISGSRVTAGRAPTIQSDESSCVKLGIGLIEGAYRDTCPDLMEYLCEELNQVQKRQKELVKAGSDSGYDSPSFQEAVVAWRKSLDVATCPVYQAQQEKDLYLPVTFQKTLEKLRNPRPEEPEPTTAFELSLGNAEERSMHVKYKKVVKRKYPDPPLVDVYYRACQKYCLEFIHEVQYKQRQVVLWSLLEEDLQHVERRLQALFDAEKAAAIKPPTVKRMTCNDGIAQQILKGELKLIVTAGYRKVARQSW